MYIKRHLEQQILDASRFYPVVMVTGQRQVGKSTMLYHIKEEDRRYVTLDDFNARTLAENDPELFLETYGTPLLIDEFQRVPSILTAIKKNIDIKALNGEPNEGLYWITGSQNFKMMQNVSESLAGRVAVFDMAGISTSELENRTAFRFEATPNALKCMGEQNHKKSSHEIYQRIFDGGMPKLLTTEVTRERYYADYVNTYLERDIKDLAQVGKLNEFYNFMIYMASHTAQELKYSEIANSIGISQPTAKAWVSILERSGIIYILRPYYTNLTKRLVKTPKMYFMDTGLACYLCRWPDASTLENGAMDGAILETYVVSEILKSYYNTGTEPNLYYYRDSDKKEIDLLIVEAGKVYPIEIKKSKAPRNADKNFSVMDKIGLDVQPGVIACLIDEVVPEDRKLWKFPISAL